MFYLYLQLSCINYLKMNLIAKKSDSIGVLASMICLVHCIATPFIFIAQACSSSCCESTPIWWKWIDYLFLIISFVAVYYSTKLTTNKKISLELWLSWVALFLIILNEKIQLIHLPEYSIYIPALSLIILHIYNKKFCHCKDDKCCTTNPGENE